jgi:hypothetical protein
MIEELENIEIQRKKQIKQNKIISITTLIILACMMSLLVYLVAVGSKEAEVKIIHENITNTITKECIIENNNITNDIIKESRTIINQTSVQPSQFQRLLDNAIGIGTVFEKKYNQHNYSDEIYTNLKLAGYQPQRFRDTDNKVSGDNQTAVQVTVFIDVTTGQIVLPKDYTEFHINNMKLWDGNE